MPKTYDLIIIGGGAAGFAAANTANKKGIETLMINNPKSLPLGGTCVNVGCVPSKALLHIGEEYYYPKNSRFKAVNLKGPINLIDALKEVNQMIKLFRKQNYQSVVEKQKNVRLVNGKAVFEDENTVVVSGKKYRGKKFLISTGAKTFEPEIKGIKNIEYLTNVSVLKLKKQPKSIVIIGGGPLGLEWGQIFHHFGTKVTILQRSSRVLKKEDPVISKEIKKHLTEEGIKTYTNAKTKKISKKGNNLLELLVEVEGKNKTFSAEQVMLATGLNPNTKELNLEYVGVTLDNRGFVKVNKYLQTSKKHIYAAGDVTGIMPLETVAAKQGYFAALNALNNAKKTVNYEEIPHAVFTSPQVASVGITEQAYMEKHGTCLCSTIGLEHSEKAQAIKDVRGLIRMVLNHKTKEVVGVHIVSPMAAELITTATYAVRNKMTIDDIRDTVHVFPTMSEIIKKVAQSFEQDLEEMACCVE